MGKIYVEFQTFTAQRCGSTLAQVMACCLTAPNHYLNQCWLVNETRWAYLDYLWGNTGGGTPGLTPFPRPIFPSLPLPSFFPNFFFPELRFFATAPKHHRPPPFFVNSYVDLLGVSETKLNDTFPDGQFHVDNYMLTRKDCTSHDGGVALCVRSDTPQRRGRRHDLDSRTLLATLLRVLKLLSLRLPCVKRTLDLCYGI